ncbi:hypothetical protein HNQ07_004576 [Deinococcus metalli]|uniref:Uncharacterized protein n=1 Tax=Deinococcus metalli TaxID=1141878 RepID=A0A7W8KL89_9DEIO|nr:hypothetical protein [Deinococcus metalli]
MLQGIVVIQRESSPDSDAFKGLRNRHSRSPGENRRWAAFKSSSRKFT